MSIDPFLPFFVSEASEGECYVVRGQRVGAFVEISLSRDRHDKHRFGSDTYTEIEELAVRRFPHADVSTYVAYASRLEDVARAAARGELGCYVHTVSDATGVRVCVVTRRLTDDGHLETEISHEHRFDDPDSHTTLVGASEKAAELRAVAQQLNDQLVSLRRARLLELRTEYEQADALAQAATGLQRIIDAEQD
jgi:microcystin degradation protein MlrC